MIDNGKDTYMNVPCHEVDLDGIKLDISNDLKKEYIIASTNAVREKTDRDRLLDVEKLGKVYAALKREEKKAVGRQRDFIAQATGMAPRTVQNLMKIRCRLTLRLNWPSCRKNSKKKLKRLLQRSSSI